MLENKIQLHSRYPDVCTFFSPINENSGILTTNSNTVRAGFNEANKELDFIDFEGGPMLSIGSYLNGKKIKSIKAAYYVELE